MLPSCECGDIDLLSESLLAGFSSEYYTWPLCIAYWFGVVLLQRFESGFKSAYETSL